LPWRRDLGVDDRDCLIGLHLNARLTPRRLHRLLSAMGSARAVWQASAGAMASVLGDADAADAVSRSRDPAAALQEQERAARAGVEIVTVLDARYPTSLRSLRDSPAVICVRGDLKVLERACVAIVGTRRASGYGRIVARRMGFELAGAGVAVVSGLARGIDAAAHEGALDATGGTVAVLGSGLLYELPAWQRDLAARIQRGGALISEFPLEMRPTRWSFPQRNRLLSAISKVVVVVEAPLRSGALITADWALRQGKDVFAVPGQVTSARSAGSNELLRDGASLATSAGDVLLAIGARRIERSDDEALSGMGAVERAIYEHIDLEPVHIDDIIARGGFTPAEAAHTLLALEMADLIRELPGKRFIRVR